MAKKRKQEPEQPKAESTAEEDSGNSSDESSIGSDTAAEIATKLTNVNDDALSSESEDDDQPTSVVQPPPPAVPVQSTTTTSSIKSDGRYHNKQRLLVLSSRGITARYRHLLEDLRTLIPHSKKESKLDVGKFCVVLYYISMYVLFLSLSVSHIYILNCKHHHRR